MNRRSLLSLLGLAPFAAIMPAVANAGVVKIELSAEDAANAIANAIDGYRDRIVSRIRNELTFATQHISRGKNKS